MGRHKKRFRAKLDADRQLAIESQGRVRVAVELETGDVGRGVDLYLTGEELDWLQRARWEGRLRHSIEDLKREHDQKLSALQVQVWQEQASVRGLKRELEQLQQAAPPNKSVAADLPQKEVPPPPPSRLTH